MKKKIVVSILLIISMFILNINNVYATEIQNSYQVASSLTEGFFDGMRNTANNINNGNNGSTAGNSSGVNINTNTYEPNPLTEDDYGKAFDMTSTIVDAITVIGVIISLTMVIALGIKYMVGSVEEKAEYKRTMIPMLIGAVFIFASSTIVSIIYNLASQL